MSTSNCEIMYYHNIGLSYVICTETASRFVTCKFYACVIDCSICH